MLGGLIAKPSVGVDPGIEDRAGEIVIVVLDRLQDGLEELWPGGAAGVPVSVHP